MIAPEAPAGGLIREAVLDDEADRRGDDAFGVVAAGSGQVGAVGVEVPAALRAEVLGVGQDQVAGPPGDEIPEVVEGALEDPVAVGAVAAAGARTPPIVAAASAEFGLGQVLDAGKALGRVGEQRLKDDRTDATTYLSGSCHNLPIIDVCTTADLDRSAEHAP
jgi:hypothetical protein